MTLTPFAHYCFFVRIERKACSIFMIKDGLGLLHLNFFHKFTSLFTENSAPQFQNCPSVPKG